MEVATRHSIRLPPALALSGKAFTQMQLAVGQLAPIARSVRIGEQVPGRQHAPPGAQAPGSAAPLLQHAEDDAANLPTGRGVGTRQRRTPGSWGSGERVGHPRPGGRGGAGRTADRDRRRRRRAPARRGRVACQRWPVFQAFARRSSACSNRYATVAISAPSSRRSKALAHRARIVRL